MKKFLQLTSMAAMGFFLMTIFSPEVKAQSYTAFQGDNYAGISAVYDNPASIADSRYLFDMTVFGSSTSAYNDYFGLQRRLMFQQANIFNKSKRNVYRNILLNEPWDLPYDRDVKDRYVTRNGVSNADKLYSLNASFDMQMLNAMLSLKGGKMAVGITERVRGISSVNGVSQNMADLFFHDGPASDFTTTNPILDETSRYAAASWNEIGLTFASEVMNEGEHYVKGGATLKFYSGLASVYMATENLDVKVVEGENNIVLNQDGEGKIMYGMSEGFNDNYIEVINKRGGASPSYDYSNIGVADMFGLATDKFFRNLGSHFKHLGLGLDLGVVYEWRPDYEDYTYEMDGQTGLVRQDQNKYTLKVSLAVTDLMLKSIGYVRDNEFTSMMFAGTNVAFNSGNFSNIMTMTSGEINNAINSSFDAANLTAASELFKVKVSPTMNLNADYKIMNTKFYVNLGASVPFSAFSGYAVKEFKKDIVKVHGNTVINLTPRFENKKFGVSLPMTLLPDYVGTAGGADNNTYAPFNVGLGLRLGPVWIGSNTILTNCLQNYWNGVDICAAVKVPILYKAPKDIDGDGVSDEKDECMYIPGTWETRGCPDTDGDGIIDSEDECPYHAGLPEFNGCPDRDGDGIPDKDDKCPDVPGVKHLQGCPEIADRDGDGVPDDEDLCPDDPGLLKFKGCPDTDGDGVIDIEDNCPTIPGPISNYGCPIETMVKTFSEDALPGVNFDTNKDNIKPQYHAELDAFAEALLACSNPKIHIIGHTDATGNDAINDPLSVRRAESVKKYLVKKGIDGKIITTSGEGSHNPIATNKTREGRAKNRRVEIEVTFE